MREKLALAAALTGFAAVTALGVGVAGAEQQSSLGAAQPTGPFKAAAPAGETETVACANGVDDDGDQLVDLDDPGCADATGE
ncbi:MAG TPA: hypothetical protein VFT10_03820, partial [Solirubrobacterales bacterium]|nr:hypothetical protein [Solirubrobacterales bacterium]